MINITIPSSRPKPKYDYPYTAINKLPLLLSNTSELTIEQEIARRQGIIDSLLSSFTYKIGNTIKMKNDSPEGTFRIKYIVKKLHEMKEAWPMSDNPMLVSVQSDDLPKEWFNCTTNKIGSLVCL